MPWDSFERFLFVTLFLIAAHELPAVEPSSLDSAPAAADQLKALNDQTIIQSSVWLDTEWDQFKQGAEEAGGHWEDYGGGAVVTGKTGLCGLRCRSFMIGAMKHLATPT
jgi:hypothetical protein